MGRGGIMRHHNNHLRARFWAILPPCVPVTRVYQYPEWGLCFCLEPQLGQASSNLEGRNDGLVPKQQNPASLTFLRSLKTISEVRAARCPNLSRSTTRGGGGGGGVTLYCFPGTSLLSTTINMVPVCWRVFHFLQRAHGLITCSLCSIQEPVAQWWLP